jgi:hypothetical protein
MLPGTAMGYNRGNGITNGGEIKATVPLSDVTTRELKAGERSKLGGT